MNLMTFLKNVRNFVYKLHLRNPNIGESSLVYGSKLSREVRVGKRCNIQGSEFGDYSYCGDDCKLPQTRVGKFCSIASGVELAAGNHPKSFMSTHPAIYSVSAYPKTSFVAVDAYEDEFVYVDENSKILCEIGNDVWIATRALLVCGKDALKIGDGCIIAAGAVVTKSTPPYSIVAGVPAKVIGWRFDECTIEALELLRWWDKDDAWIRGHARDFSDIETLLRDAGFLM